MKTKTQEKYEKGCLGNGSCGTWSFGELKDKPYYCDQCEAFLKALEEQAQEMSQEHSKHVDFINQNYAEHWGKASEIVIDMYENKLSQQKQKFEEVLNNLTWQVQSISEVHNLGDGLIDLFTIINQSKEALNNQSPQGNTILSPAGKLESDSKHFEDKAPELTKTSALYPSSQDVRGSNSYSRVTLVDNGNRIYDKFDLKSVELSVQDEGRTLKIFIDSKEENSNVCENCGKTKEEHIDISSKKRLPKPNEKSYWCYGEGTKGSKAYYLSFKRKFTTKKEGEKK